MKCKNELIKAFEEFKKSAFKLEEEMDNAIYETEKDNTMSEYPNFYFCEEYPFDISFDELTIEIADWANTQIEIIKGEK